MKKILNEQGTNLYATSEARQWEQITDPYLKTAAASGCFGDGFKIDIKHPEDGTETVQQTIEYNGKPAFAFYTNRDSKKNPGQKLTDIYSGSPGNYTYIKTVSYKCNQLQNRTNPDYLSGISQELHNVLTRPVDQNGLGYKPFGEVKGTDIMKYDLVSLQDDPDLKPGGKYYKNVSGIQKFLDTVKSQKLNFLMWKPKLSPAPNLDIEKKREEVLAYYASSGFTPCASGQFASGEAAIIDVHKNFPQSFDKGFTVCKEWIKIGQTKEDCRAVFDSFYEEIKRYEKTQGRQPANVKVLTVVKPLVLGCISEWKGKMPARKKEMELFQSIRAGSPFFLGESTDKITNVIRESLKIIKRNKNSY